LAALGADVIKVEAPGRGDPGRTSELHTVLGQGKRGIVLNLKMEEGRQLARDLAQHSHVLVENFATGVMERFGLDAKTLRATNPGLSYVSASGLGREGPQAGAVAYGTLLQCYSGFAELNGIPGHAPKVGMAWLDPMCGLLLTFVTGACVYQHERSGRGTRIDFSMVEAMLWTMLMPLLECQNGGVAEPQGNASEWYSPHGMFATAGEDKWIALAVTNENQWRELCSLIPALSSYARWTLEDRRRDDTKIIQALQTWCGEHDGNELEALLASRDICAAVVKNAIDLANCEQLVAREFWDELDTGRAPGLPWRSSLDRHLDMAPGHGEHTDAILAEVLGLTGERINVLRNSGALG
jgi:benzylsuccinate CoA-transferase BbsF subunit